MRAAGVAVALAACGRLDFAPLGSGTGDAGRLDGAGATVIVVVQTATNGSANVPSTTIPFVTQSGSLIVATIESDFGATVAGLTDDGSNLYVQIGALATDPNSGIVDLWYAPQTNASTMVTATATNAMSISVHLYEVTGVDPMQPIDRMSATSSEGASLEPTSAITTTVAGDLVIANVDAANAVTGLHPGDAFTSDMAVLDTDGFAHLVAGAPGTYTATWDQTIAGTFCANAVAFAPAR